MTSLATLLEASAQRHPAHAALRCVDESITYEQLWDRALRFAASLRLTPGDRVVLQLQNSIDFVVAAYGIWAAGGVVVPLHITATDTEVRTVVDDSDAVRVLRRGDIQLGAAAARAVDRADDEPAAILYTSGTSGDPKGVVLTHANLLTNATVASRDVARFTADDVMLVTVQFAHAFGLTSVLNACLYAGTTLVVPDRWHPQRALDLMRQHAVTVVRGVPTTYIDLLSVLENTPDAPQLRAAFSGGAAMAPQLLTNVEETFGTTVWEGYGLTEAAPLVACNQVEHGRRPGTVGHAVPGVEVRIADDGELLARGPNVMAGYWRRPSETARTVVDGWLRTGDLGSYDDAGFLVIAGRSKDVIKRGGATVYPLEVEAVLLAHPGIRAAAVVGVPDGRYGERVAAAVVSSGEAPSRPELIHWCRERLSPYKCPDVLVFVDALPLGPTGKVLRRKLVARLANT